VNLSKREGLLQCHHHIPRIVVVGETIRGSSAQDSHLMRFGRIRIQTGPSGAFSRNVRPARIVFVALQQLQSPVFPTAVLTPVPPTAPFGGRIGILYGPARSPISRRKQRDVFPV
jgi:hypothetical protein